MFLLAAPFHVPQIYPVRNILFLFLFLFLFILVGCNPSGHDRLVAGVKPFIVVRSDQSAQAKETGKIPFQGEVTVLETGSEKELFGLKGPWVRVQAADVTGWIFAPLLVKSSENRQIVLFPLFHARNHRRIFRAYPQPVPLPAELEGIFELGGAVNFIPPEGSRAFKGGAVLFPDGSVFEFHYDEAIGHGSRHAYNRNANWSWEDGQIVITATIQSLDNNYESKEVPCDELNRISPDSTLTVRNLRKQRTYFEGEVTLSHDTEKTFILCPRFLAD